MKAEAEDEWRRADLMKGCGPDIDDLSVEVNIWQPALRSQGFDLD